jgi:hypothetical protein
MIAPDPLCLALLFLPVLYVSILLHEVGHAVAGWGTGFVVTSLGLGTGRTWCVIPLRGALVFF